MRGIPRALGCIAYLSVWREVGALCVERLAVFVPYIQSSFRRCVQNCFPVSQDSFWVQLRVCSGGNTTSGELAIELG